MFSLIHQPSEPSQRTQIEMETLVHRVVILDTGGGSITSGGGDGDEAGGGGNCKSTPGN